MGIAPLFCCFSGKSPNCIVLTGLAASFIALSFLLWGLADLWFDRDGALAIYIIAFVFHNSYSNRKENLYYNKLS